MPKHWKRVQLVALSALVLITFPWIAARSFASGGRRFKSRYITITINTNWKVDSSQEPVLTLKQGKYVLAINPQFGHASGIAGGRFYEIVSGMKGIAAVTHDLGDVPYGPECARWPPGAMAITKDISLQNLYTDRSKSGHGCHFPSGGKTVWFGSYFSGDSNYGEYTITLDYATTDVNSLPEKGSPELTRIFREAVSMLKTLNLKPPVSISRIDPQSAPSGATVTMFGSGLDMVTYIHFYSADNIVPVSVLDPSGTSLTFEVPSSIRTNSGTPIRVNEVDVNECPPDFARTTLNFCGMPTPPGKFDLSVIVPGVDVPPVPFVVTSQEPRPVSISLVYPNYMVSARTPVTVQGSGFTPTGNTVKIGTSIVSNLVSPDGKTIKFTAPPPAGNSLYHGLLNVELSVVNANGESNSIIFDYR